MVAASKMRRAQEADALTAPYTRAASELLTYLASQGATKGHSLFEVRSIKNRLIIVIASDRGLAGAYNSNVFKAYIRELQSSQKSSQKMSTITVGRKASQFSARLKDNDIIGVFEDLPDKPSGSELRTILDTAVTQFVDKKVDAVDIIYTEFISSINQKVEVKRILPAGFEETEISQNIKTAEYEPNAEEVLDAVVYRLVEAQIFQAMLDAKASEYSMRMLAMKNATDNANDLIDDLTLEMNKARQAKITQELAEISGGVEALKE